VSTDIWDGLSTFSWGGGGGGISTALCGIFGFSEVAPGVFGVLRDGEAGVNGEAGEA